MDGNAIKNVGRIELGDNAEIRLGDGVGGDAVLFYDGTNLVINPKNVGTGIVSVLGDLTATGNLQGVDINATGVFKLNGTSGISQTFDPSAATEMIVTGGLVTSVSIP